MNEKFFDIKKEKQDRILNAVLKVFAQNGFKRAATDEMVKEALISKGLLFHYFTTKAGMYEFVYRYSVKYMAMELTYLAGSGEEDYFRIKKKIEEVKREVSKHFSYMPSFLDRALEETDIEIEEGVREEVDNIRKEHRELIQKLEGRADFTKYPSFVEKEKLCKLANDVLKALWKERKQTDATAYLEMLRQMCER